jgi:2-polyprenyl-3-methyl-5-hydroxy-6-metoxy-1,4-benzoquinol methylase
MLARLLHLRQRFTIQGVRYRAVSAEPLEHALARGGYKDYDVTFSDGGTMRISATRARRFADVHGIGVLDLYRPMQPLLVPGMRILLLESGTGAAAVWASHLVGPAGAVVALDRDQQSIDYAQKRYRPANIAFECAGVEALQGETDGAFQTAVAIEALRQQDDAAAVIGELWRVVAPGGFLLIIAPVELEDLHPCDLLTFTSDSLAEAVEQAIAGGGPHEPLTAFQRGSLAMVLVQRAAEE